MADRQMYEIKTETKTIGPIEGDKPIVEVAGEPMPGWGSAQPRHDGPKSVAARQALITAEAKAKLGRPPKHKAKPWDKDGISRSEWYRRQKAKP